ncbi:MAG: ankyrin repeat domain-containing protein [Campylobacteraceae bacterium]|nr:ankyrin repeat domain-containing protein [Campylobacteraceae bacterium]
MKKTIASFFVLLLVITGCSIKNEKMNVSNNIEEIKVKTVNMIDINKNDFIGELSIHDAVRSKDINIVQFLISKKSQLNDKDKYGYTPLHLAVRGNQLEIVQLLLKGGAEVNSTDVYGDTPLLDSVRNKYTEISEFLICNGALRNVSDDHERTPLNYAAATNDLFIVNLLIESNLEKVCNSKTEISINTMVDFHELTPNICGTFTNLLTDIQVSVQDKNEKTYGPYVAKIDNSDNTWCAKVTDSLEYTDYTATAVAMTRTKKELTTTGNFFIELEDEKKEMEVKETNDFISSEHVEILDSLYEALNDEFQDDFENWNAELDKKTLVFRFKSPHLMFEHGNSQLKQNYKEVLDTFFPRYIKILEDYEAYIETVFIEGHTSSEYKMGKNDEEKFEFNMALSEKRAKEVVKYVTNINSIIIKQSSNWINNIFKAVGKSSSELIRNSDGSENSSLSRRVDFKIKTIESE